MLGPDKVPVIADAREAERDVPLAVLSAMTHGRGPKAAALKTIDADTAAAFVQFADLDQLEAWARRAVHATDAAELFVDQ